jgi:hypothetical protein
MDARALRRCPGLQGCGACSLMETVGRGAGLMVPWCRVVPRRAGYNQSWILIDGCLAAPVLYGGKNLGVFVVSRVNSSGEQPVPAHQLPTHTALCPPLPPQLLHMEG